MFALALFVLLADAAAAASSTGLSGAQWALISLGIATAASFAYGYVQKKKGDRSARLVRAAFAGIRKGVQDHAEHKDVFTTIEDAIYAAAEDLNVAEQHVDAHVGDGLVPPPPPSA